MAAAMGMGEWAAAYTQIDEGIEQLLLLANSPLWRVRFAAALGLQRMLMRAWDATIRRFRAQALVANPQEWQAIVASWSHAEGDFLLDEPTQILDTLDLLNSGLRFMRDMEEHRFQAKDTNPVLTSLQISIATVVETAPHLGFAQMRAWALWQDAHVTAILRESLQLLEGFPEECRSISAVINGD
jgi:hypothetical protein